MTSSFGSAENAVCSAAVKPRSTLHQRERSDELPDPVLLTHRRVLTQGSFVCLINAIFRGL